MRLGRFRLVGFTRGAAKCLAGNLEPLTPLVPYWLSTVTVRYAEEPSAYGGIGSPLVYAATSLAKPYRDAMVSVYPLLLAQTGKAIRRTLRHELAHLPTYRYQLVMEGIISDLAGDGTDAHKALMRIVRDEAESATEDVARIYTELQGD